MRKSILYIPSHKISFLEFTDSPNGFPIALEVICFWKNIVINNVCAWNLVPRKYDIISNIIIWNHLSCVSYKTCDFIIHSLILFI